MSSSSTGSWHPAVDREGYRVASAEGAIEQPVHDASAADLYFGVAKLKLPSDVSLL